MKQIEHNLERLQKGFSENQNLDFLYENLMALTTEVNNELLTKKSMPQKIAVFSQSILNNKRSNPNSSYVPTGFADFDNGCGFEKGEFIVIGGRPGMGKSSFLMQLTKNMAKNKVNMLYFTLELSGEQLTKRLMTFVSSLTYKEINQGNSTVEIDSKINEAAKELSNYPLFISDTNSSIIDIKLKCLKIKEESNIDVIFIDYIQLIKGANLKNSNREFEVAQICRELKTLALELNVCIITTSQLSRAVETRGGDKRPELSDLRESGSIEQNSDKVLFLYRPDYYDITEDENGNSLRGIMEVVVAKNRNGGLRNYAFKVNSTFSKIEPHQEQNNNTHPFVIRIDDINTDLPF